MTLVASSVFESLRKLPTASWAIWSDSGPSDIEFFQSKRESLHSRVVFVGLNRSGKQDETFGDFKNFHKVSHRGDRALKAIIQGGGLQHLIGAYMTDLSADIETDSRKVSGSRSSFDELERQIRVFTKPPEAIVCFGGRVFKELRKYWSAHSETASGLETADLIWSRLFKVYHYSMNGFNNKNVEEKLPLQLACINKLLDQTD